MKLRDSTAVGIFTIGGILAFIAATFLFTKDPIFGGRSHSFVLYFNESVNGLEVGAPVKLRGVRIGQVKRIMAQFNQDRERVLVPVTISIEDAYFRAGRRERLRLTVGDRNKLFGDSSDESAHGKSAFCRSPLIVGMVGSLQMESFVTGKLFVGLEYAPTPAGKYLRPDCDGIPEIPTRPSNLESFSDHLSSIADGLSRINYAAIGMSVERITGSISSVDMGSLSAATAKLAAAVASAADSGDAKAVISSMVTFCKNLAALSTAVLEQLRPALPELAQAIASVSSGACNFSAMLDPNSNFSFAAARLLRSMDWAARTIALFFEFLEQQPNAILTGKAKEGR
ncbi:MAG: MlaD family protein [Puniceicoccales bacterium]|jgi:paraquat-inducible protein B|nr:MlaD family protein [Puniceicoccales bacterium]